MRPPSRPGDDGTLVLFNSLPFLVFAAAFYAGFPFAKQRDTSRFVFIIVASCIFYGFWNFRFLPLLVATALVDYLAALGMERWPRRRAEFLTASIATNVGALVYFKYALFLTNAVLSLCGMDDPYEKATLPIGISFYTFQSMSYTIDVYRGKVTPTRSFLHFFSSICLFPHLVAGPIVRSADLLPQLSRVPHTTEEDRFQGFSWIVHGYFKKMVIADNLAPVVNLAFGAPKVSASGVYWWVVVTMFAFQIYYDFAGYTDIARGLAKLMGYDFAINFESPYVAAGMRDFWTRWHISLSSWFRDYVYVPLGGDRHGPIRAHRNLWITMILSGLWHGADVRFAIWGALHALYVSVERITSWSRWLARTPTRRPLATALVLLQVWVAWVFFRAESLAQAIRILGTMFRLSAGDAPSVLPYAPFLVVACVCELGGAWSRRGPSSARPAWLVLAERPVLAGMIATCIFLRGAGNAFIYFQF